VEKKATIEKLRKEGLFDLNRSMKLPLLPKRLAVISVETSKGYQDFMLSLSRHEGRYGFSVTLFPSLLQGDEAVKQLTDRIKEITQNSKLFDAALILRGGGGDVGLQCYNHYDLASAIATCPVPVITGIGHSTDTTVADMVAYSSYITPTDAASFLINCFAVFEQNVSVLQERIFRACMQRVKENRLVLASLTGEILRSTKVILRDAYSQSGRIAERIPSIFHARIEKASHYMNTVIPRISHARKRIISESEQILDFQKRKLVDNSNHLFRKEKNRLQHFEEKVRILDPKEVLKRGYTYTLFQGKSVRSIDEINTGMEVTTVLQDGSYESKVTNTKKDQS